MSFDLSDAMRDIIVVQYGDLYKEEPPKTFLNKLFNKKLQVPELGALKTMEKYQENFHLRVVFNAGHTKAQVERFLEKYGFPFNDVYGVSCSAELEYMVEADRVLALMSKTGADMFGRAYSKIERW